MLPRTFAFCLATGYNYNLENYFKGLRVGRTRPPRRENLRLAPMRLFL
jgi:hypothetical protein